MFDGRAGEWLERKRAWLRMGITSEVGRDVELFNTETWMHGDWKAPTVSVFDPVLAEYIVSLWSLEGAQVVDPFAGGSVRGIVSAHLGRRYWGIGDPTRAG